MQRYDKTLSIKKKTGTNTPATSNRGAAVIAAQVKTSAQTGAGRHQTLEQRRAAHAWLKAEEGVARHSKDYVNDAKAAPALIMNSGLMQVLAYLEAKDDRHKLLASHLRHWLHETHGLPKDFKECMAQLLDTEPREFQELTAEALAWLKWLRQMANARYKTPDASV